jgi:hypothetical protein
LKFRLKIGKGSVQEFTDAAGVVYKPGEVVDLPSSYEGEVWLERVDPVLVVAALPGRIEPVAVVDALTAVVGEPALVPFAAKPKRQRARKLPRLFRRN